MYQAKSGLNQSFRLPLENQQRPNGAFRTYPRPTHFRMCPSASVCVCNKRARQVSHA